MTSNKFNRRDVLRTGGAAGLGVWAASHGLPAFAQDAAPEMELPQGAAGKLTVIHRTEYFEAAQTLFRQTVEQFAAQNNTKLDISTTNPESFGDFLGKMPFSASLSPRNGKAVLLPRNGIAFHFPSKRPFCGALMPGMMLP